MSAKPEIGRHSISNEDDRLQTLQDADLLDTLPEDNFDEPIETDIGLLERIAMNLVNNSIQACPPGSLE